MPVLVLLHDEVREWHPRALRIVAMRELQRHAAIRRFALDANDVNLEVQRFFAGQIEIERGFRAFIERQIDSHEQATLGDVLDEAVDDESSIRAQSGSNLDGDPYRFPFVHVGKGRLLPHVGQSNCNYGGSAPSTFNQVSIETTSSCLPSRP